MRDFGIWNLIANPETDLGNLAFLQASTGTQTHVHRGGDISLNINPSKFRFRHPKYSLITITLFTVFGALAIRLHGLIKAVTSQQAANEGLRALFRNVSNWERISLCTLIP